ncbi:MAG: MarR family transcriptional regulator [Lachnospiraceae bacterium]|nr:MarR family transcriptional regulator [Robinsoniella sp.]MDY3767704.1 MarR family transcriptional regulator [Lachnospiraceae bacterium]
MLSEFWNSMHLAKKLYDRKLEPVCEKYQMARMELDILLFLSKNPGFDTATDIVDRKRFAKSHVSLSLKTLEERGYIQRVCYPENRKTVHLKLLPEAALIVQSGQEAQREFMKAAFGTFGEQEWREIGVMFEKIAENIRRELE